MRPRPLPALVVVAASASLLGAGRLWFSALKSDRVVTSPPALYAPPLVTPHAPQPPLVVHAAPVTPVKPAKTVTKHVHARRAHTTSGLKVTQRGVGGVSIVVDIGSAVEHTQTPQPVAPPKPIVVPPLPTAPTGHPKPKPKPKPKPVPVQPKPKPVTPPAPAPPTPAPAPAPTPATPVATATPPSPPVVTQTPPPSTPPVEAPTPPTPPADGTPSPPVVNGSDGSDADTRPGWGSGDKNHVHTGPPGQNKKSGD